MSDPGSPLLIFDEQLLEQRAYWLQQLAALPASPAGLPLVEDLSDEPTASWQQLSVEVPLDLSERLRKLTSGNTVLAHCVCTTVVKIVLYRYTGQSPVIIGVPHRCGGENGSAGEALMILDTVTPEMSFRKLLEGVRKTLAGAHANSRYPFSRLVQDLQREASASLFDVTVAFESVHVPMPDLGQNLNLRWYESNDRYGCDIAFRATKYVSTTVKQFAGHMLRVLEACLTTPQRPIQTLPLLDSLERHGLLSLGCGVGAE
ncbi:MAG: condensation domain-containing protein, partial [Planctomycetaceae bacterium]|nr:condensation domain-containing protein [Planctomycetaceae bacterium]